MNPVTVFLVISGYFAVLIMISHFSSRNADSDTYFTGNRQSPWYVVAFGMIGASLSGITFISVPGEVGNSNLHYFQLVIGFLVGFFVIANVLLPLYYKWKVVSIYSYLGKRFGLYSHKTGSLFFLASQSIGASLRLFVVAGVLQLAFFDHLKIPFFITVVVTILLIWIYTRKAGIKTIVWTDTFQTTVMLFSVITSILIIAKQLHLTPGSMIQTIAEHPYSRIFNWDWNHETYFFKQFITGALVAIAMTGLDQNEMQKNLTCRNLPDAKKNMYWFSVSLVLTNLLFLSLGVLLYAFVQKMNIALPTGPAGEYINSDDLYPNLTLNYFSPAAGIIFLCGITAAAFSSADSALTSLTTAFCTDILNLKNKSDIEKIRVRRRVNIGISIMIIGIIMIFRAINNESVINTVYTVAGYTYGPLLGLYAFGLFTSIPIKDKWVPVICVFAPVISYFMNIYTYRLFDFKFGFSVLLVNGLITFLGLWIIRNRS
ncbi:sodium:solute symporter [Bacteroidota bacterium]